MKLLTTLFVLIIQISVAYGQNTNLRIEAFKNSTGKLSDNTPTHVDSLLVVDENSKAGQTFHFKPDDKPFISLISGEYTIICFSEGREGGIVLNGVVVSDDKITFLKVLFEPKLNLTWRQKRKRDKLKFAFR